MDSNNYFLNLLKSKCASLEKLLTIDDDTVSEEEKTYAIAGLIVQLSSIIEIGIGDLHSSNFDDITSIIYYTRQKIVHYGYFNGLKNIQSIGQNIVDLFNTNYNEEQKYFSALFQQKKHKAPSNIVLKPSNLIEKDNHFYKFYSKDKKQVLYVPIKSVFTLNCKGKEKPSSFIVDTNYDLACYSLSNSNTTPYVNKENDNFEYEISNYKSLNSNEIKDYLTKNYIILHEDFEDHTISMETIINSFITDPLNSIQIIQYHSDDQFCKNTVDVIKDFMFNNTMNEGYIDSNYLIKDKYSLSKMPATDFSKLRKELVKPCYDKINEKDIFFVDCTINRFNYFTKLFDSPNLDLDPKALSVVLIQLFESGPKHFSSNFINSNLEFKKCYNNLLRYRQVFSHYVISNKEFSNTVNKFFKEFSNFVQILQNLNLNSIKKPMLGLNQNYLIIERNKDNFFNYKHEQFLRIDNDKYIGKKIQYSSRLANSKSLIAILPGGNSTANTCYYKKDNADFLSPYYVYDEHSKKEVLLNLSKQPLKGTKEVSADLSLSYLFKAYYLLKRKNEKEDIDIIFLSSKTNKNTCHKDHLTQTILRYFNQGYIPLELLQKVKLDTSSLNKGVIVVLNMKDEPICKITNSKKIKNSYSSVEYDNIDFFSRTDDITHDYSKRRPAK